MLTLYVRKFHNEVSKLILTWVSIRPIIVMINPQKVKNPWFLLTQFLNLLMVLGYLQIFNIIKITTLKNQKKINSGPGGS